jgi:DHA1 family multidrug resistance protein-like MFS transporter
MRKISALLEEIYSLDSDIKVVILSVFLFAVGYGSIMSYFPLLLRKLGASSTDVGLIYSVITASAAISALIGGLLLSKFDLRIFTTVVSLIIAPFALIMYFANDWRLGIVAGILDGVSYGAAPAFSTIIYLRSKKTKIGFNFGLFSSSFSAGAAFSPALGGFLARTYGIRAPFLFAFFSLLASALVCLYLRPGRIRGGNFGIRQAFKIVFEDRRFISILVVFMLLILVETTYDPFLSIYLREVHDLSYSVIGLLVSLVFIINFFSSPLIGRMADRFGSSLALGTALLGYSISLLILGTASVFKILLISIIGIGVFKQVYSMSSIATARNAGRLPPHIAYASLHFLRTSLSVLGPLLGGYIASHSIRGVFLFAAAVYFLFALGSITYFKFKPER